MKLQSRFIQIPLSFDADRLAEEVSALGEAAWLRHPMGFAGNDYLPLVAVRGDPQNDSFAGAMRPTPHLEQCPYLVDVLAALGVCVGRTRLMRLAGNAEVKPHVDVHYYWRERMRVHVPIVTQPTVRFICGDEERNMKAGECWVFDTWAWHRVINDATRQRIHLVVDTVGGEGFRSLMANGRSGLGSDPAGWSARGVAPYGATLGELDFENANCPSVMTPWEMREHVDFLLRETDSSQAAFEATARATEHFVQTWRVLWSRFGAEAIGRPHYQRAIDGFSQTLRETRAETLKLINGYDFAPSLRAMVVGVALGPLAS
jgi:hypothetical protein